MKKYTQKIRLDVVLDTLKDVLAIAIIASLFIFVLLAALEYASNQ